MFVEDETTELKVMLTKGIKKEIVAFANTNGGTIYLGIDDDGNIVGLDDPKGDMEKITGMVKDGIYADLSTNVRLKIEEINQKNVVVVEVSPGSHKPYYLSDKGLKPSGVYIRFGNASVPASDELIRRMILDAGEFSYTEEPSSVKDLHFSYFESVAKPLGLECGEVLFKTLGFMAPAGYYTNLGLLFSDECPFSTKVAVFQGTDVRIFRDRREFTGSLFKQLANVEFYLNIYNRTYGKIVGFQRVDRRDYPPDAIREAVLNAFIHRDYGYNASVLVSLFDDRLEISSLGGLLKGIEVSDLYKGVSLSRNPKIANVFMRLNFVESFGTGIRRIVAAYEESSRKPVFQGSGNSFQAILPNMNYEPLPETGQGKMKTEAPRKTEIAELEEMLFQYLDMNKTLKKGEAERMLGLSSTGTKRFLTRLVEEKKIERCGNGKSTYYQRIYASPEK